VSLRDGEVVKRILTDNGSVPVPTVAELSDLPSSVTSAYVGSTETLYVRSGSVWIPLSPSQSGSVSGSYTQGDGAMGVTFASPFPTEPRVVISCTVSVYAATPLFGMVYGVTTTGFKYKLFTLDGVERGASQPFIMDWQASL